jgi:general stress protein 26
MLEGRKHMQRDQVKKIRELLRSFDTALLVTHGKEWPFHARPMALARIEDNCDVWFFTGRSSEKVREIENDERVLVVCQDETHRYVALQAAAKLIIDRQKAAELWKESYEAWFPQGVDDPDLMLIRAQAESAEYWDSEGLQSVRHLFDAARAYVRGTRPHVRDGEAHGTVDLSE